LSYWRKGIFNLQLPICDLNLKSKI